MRKAIHAADLHVSRSEQQYSFAVFDELIELCRRNEVDLLLLAGDLFDSYPDAVALAPELREHAAALPEACRAVAIPGNHEELLRGEEPLETIDLGRIAWATGSPFQRYKVCGIDLFAVPFRSSYADYLTWEIPAAGEDPRIVMMHGTLAGMWFSGLEETEESTVAIDPDVFGRIGASYAALGHIHSAHTEELEGCTACYPGSARVWRRGENDLRAVQLLEFQGTALTRHERLTLTSAGRYRHLELPVGIDPGKVLTHVDEHVFDSADFVELALSGLIETQAQSAQLVRKLQHRLGPRVRRLEIDTEHLEPLSGFAALPLARHFLEHWNRRWQHAASPREKDLLLEARRNALTKIKHRVEGRR